jgi:hypothetical protein
MMVRRVFLTILSAAIALGAADPDPTIGTWRLNVAKSKYRPGPAPRSETRVYTQTKNGIKGTVTTVWSDGKSTKVEYPANYDGKDYPVTGSQGADAVVWNRIDNFSSALMLKHGGRVIGSGRRDVSPDGKTMTITYKGVNSVGDQVDNIVVYDRR